MAQLKEFIGPQMIGCYKNLVWSGISKLNTFVKQAFGIQCCLVFDGNGSANTIRHSLFIVAVHWI